MSKSVLIIGAGIAGINCALNVANYGIKVYLIDIDYSIGGLMARLDKTFPTNDCSICIEAPKMFDIKNNKNINIFTNAEVKKVNKNNDIFKVSMLIKSTFVDEKLCTGCGACIEACPVYIADELDKKIGGKRKLISMSFPQAVPNTVHIDSICRYGKMLSKGACIGGCSVDCSQCRECSIVLCKKACEQEGKNAILLWKGNKKVNIEVSSIIVATGVKATTTSGDLLNCFKYKNVITSMDFERLMNAGGPTFGEIIKPSDGEHAKKIGWIQCSGRGLNTEDGNSYCSKICCMISCKQSIVTKEHCTKVSTNIYYNELKAYGKNFWSFYQKSIDNGVKWIKGRPYYLYEDPSSKSITIRYENIIKNKVCSDELDLLVLSNGLSPNNNNYKLAKILNIELDEYGFFLQKNKFFNPLETNIDGIYLCGGATGPIDISESVVQAHGAAMKAILKSN